MSAVLISVTIWGQKGETSGEKGWEERAGIAWLVDIGNNFKRA
jgi:hypothetical protein